MSMLLFALWFFLPAGMANSAPVFANKIPWLNRLDTPMDFGKTWRGKRILGPNKRWRGLLFGVFIAILTVWLQRYAYINYQWARTISQDVNYAEISAVGLGALFGFGALLGDAVESFFKRWRGVPSGESWFPFDQSDYIIGAMVASAVIVQLSLQQYVTIFVLWFCLHLLSVYIGFLLGLRDDKI